MYKRQAAEQFVRRGILAAREVMKNRKTRTQKIVAWNEEDAAEPANEAEAKVRKILTTRGPLPVSYTHLVPQPSV